MEDSGTELYQLYKQVNQMDIVEYLRRLGHEPKRETGSTCTFQSPIRDGDTTPSFTVYKKTNTWHDWGTGKGHTMVDLGAELYGISAEDFVLKFKSLADPPPPVPKSRIEEPEDPGVQILGVRPLSSPALYQYIESRKIPLDIARKHLDQVHFKIRKEQFGVGFKNDLGGYELRNVLCKRSSVPKSSKFIDNGSSILNVTEGTFSFLSVETLIMAVKKPLPNFLILNGTGFFEQKIPLMKEHDRVDLCLDHGKGGRVFTAIGLAVDKKKFQDKSAFYSAFDDPNDWWKEVGYRQYPYRKPSEEEARARGLTR